MHAWGPLNPSSAPPGGRGPPWMARRVRQGSAACPGRVLGGSPQQHHKHFGPRVSPTGVPSSTCPVSSCSGSPGHRAPRPPECGPLKPTLSAPSSPRLDPPLSEPLASHGLAPWSPTPCPPTNLHPPPLALPPVKPPEAPSPSEQQTKSLQWTPFLKNFTPSDHPGLSLCKGPAVSMLTLSRVERLDFP